MENRLRKRLRRGRKKIIFRAKRTGDKKERKRFCKTLTRFLGSPRWLLIFEGLSETGTKALAVPDAPNPFREINY